MKRISEILKEERERKGYSLDFIEKTIKIKSEYINLIEQGRFSDLPSESYALGFIKNYAEFLGLDVQEVLAFFRREFDERKAKKKPSLKPPQPIRKTLEIFTPSNFIITIVSILVIGFLGYLYIQYRSYSKSPELFISKPTDRVQQTLSYTEVVGKTDEDAIVKVNGQTIRSAGNGNFSVTVDLSEGENKIQISAVNPLGKETVETRTVYYLVEQEVANNENQEDNINNEVETIEGVEIEVSVGPNAAWIKVTTDEVDSFEGILNPGVTRLFTAHESIRLRTGNGGSTKIKVNGVDQGLMGTEGMPVEKEYKKE